MRNAFLPFCLLLNWRKALLELFEFVASGNLLQYFLLLTASPVDKESSLLSFSVSAIVVKCPIKEMAAPSYQATLPLLSLNRVETRGRCVWSSKVSAPKDI